MGVINVQGCHVAKCTVTKDDKTGAKTYSWDTPIHFEGLESVTIAPVTAKGEKYGDGILRTKKTKRSSYTIGMVHNEIPADFKRYMQGLTYTSGVETDDGDCSAQPFALGFEHVKDDDTREMIWFIYCEAEPIEEDNKQSEGDITIGSDTINITAFKLSAYNNRGYVKIRENDANVTEQMLEDFFTKVQTSTTIEAATTT